MTMSVEFIDSRPQCEIASRIQEYVKECETIQIVSAYVSSDGIDELRINEFSEKITHFVLGAATFKAFLALDQLIPKGLSHKALRVHLGYMQGDGSPVNSIRNYRPMLHSKIYFFEMPNKKAVAFVGSHNLTKPALIGLNGEAGVLFRGKSSDPIFSQIRSHILESYDQAVEYNEEFKKAYVSWSKRFHDIHKDLEEESDEPRNKRNLIMIVKSPRDTTPEKNDRIYFEIDQTGTQVNLINTEVHSYFFDEVPNDPLDALRSRQYHTALRGKVNAIDADSGAAELEAKWCINDISNPQLQPTESPFRPIASKEKKQICVIIQGQIQARFDYEFDEGRKKSWEPISDSEEASSNWVLVTGLKEVDESKPSPNNLPEQPQDSGSFVMLSQRRRSTGRKNNKKNSSTNLGDQPAWRNKSETSWTFERTWADLFENVTRYFADLHEGKNVSFYEIVATRYNNCVALRNKNNFRQFRDLDSEYCINTYSSTKEKKRLLAKLASLVVIDGKESTLGQLVDLGGPKKAQNYSNKE